MRTRHRPGLKVQDVPAQVAVRAEDRIRVVKKTNSTDDWWEGELAGVQGYFPANYVE